MLLHDTPDLITALITKKYTLFAPTTREAIRQDFPQVDRVTELQALDNDDLLFCWFMGCPCSPIVTSTLPTEAEKIEVAAKVSYPRKAERKAQELSSNMPDKIVAGIRAFQKMDLGARVQSMLMHENTLINARLVLSINVRETFKTKDGKPDMDAIEQWAKTAKVLNALVADVVPLCEEGRLGVSEQNKDMTFADGEIMALFHAKYSS